MSLGSEDDNNQEDISTEVTEIIVNIDQAIVLMKALEVLAIDCATRKQGLVNIRQGNTDEAQNEEIRSQKRLVKFVEDKLPYLQAEIKEAIVYLQKEEDSIIKGVQSSD